MRLSDIIGHMNLAFWPIIAMILFLGVFIAVVLRIYGRTRGNFEDAARLSLDDGALSARTTTPSPSPRASESNRSARP